MRIPVPEQQPATGIAVAGRPGQDEGFAVGMREKRVRTVDGWLAISQEAGVTPLPAGIGCDPRPGRIPLQGTHEDSRP